MATIKTVIRYETYPGNQLATELSRSLAVGKGKASVFAAFAIAFGGIAVVGGAIGNTSNSTIMASFIAVLALAICSAVLIELRRTDSYKRRIAEALGVDPEKFHQPRFPKALMVCGIILGVLFALVIILALSYSQTASRGAAKLRDGDYEGATLAYEKLDSDKAKKQARDARKKWAEQLIEAEKYEEALEVLGGLSYSDGSDLRDIATDGKNYGLVKELIEAENYAGAIEKLEQLARHKYADSPELLNEAIYLYAGKLVERGDLEQAIEQLKKIEDYRDAAALRKDYAYRYATELVEQEQFDRAAEVLADYGDEASLEGLMTQVNAQRAAAMAESGNIKGAYELIQALPEDNPDRVALMESYGAEFDAMEADSRLIGTEFTLGSWYRENGLEPIRWRVLDITAPGEALVISVDILEKRAYDDSGAEKDIYWSNSSIRAWLNDDFLNYALSEEEQARVLDTERFSDGERSTVDKVFLLSGKEIASFLYEGNEMPSVRSLSNEMDWWTGNDSGDRTFVTADMGRTASASRGVASFGDAKGIRPAMRIRLEASQAATVGEGD